MARMLHKLMPERVKQKSKQIGVYADGGGLYLCVKRAASKDAPGGHRGCSGMHKAGKSAKAVNGIPRAARWGWGTARVFRSLQRATWLRWRAVLKAGNDPLAVRESERASQRLQEATAVTFKQSAKTYIETHRDS